MPDVCSLLLREYVAVVKLILRTVGEEMKIDSTDLDTSWYALIREWQFYMDVKEEYRYEEYKVERKNYPHNKAVHERISSFYFFPF